MPKIDMDLLEVFRDGYEEAYVGDERFIQGYLVPSDFPVICNEPLPYTSAALLRSSRITAIATRTDTERFGSRKSNMINLLADIRNIQPDAYITIGENSVNKVGKIAVLAGMSPSDNMDLLRTRLSAFGEVDRYDIRETDSGLAVALKTSNHGNHYWQKVYDWS